MFKMAIIAIAIFSLMFFLAGKEERDRKEKELNSIRNDINNLKDRY
jgi:hypothetical protein